MDVYGGSNNSYNGVIIDQVWFMVDVTIDTIVKMV